MNEVTEHSAQALQAVKLLAQYLGNKLPKVGVALAAPGYRTVKAQARV